MPPTSVSGHENQAIDATVVVGISTESKLPAVWLTTLTEKTLHHAKPKSGLLYGCRKDGKETSTA